MIKQNKTLKIGIFLRNRHDGPGGLEKVLEVLNRSMVTDEAELYFYALFPPQYTEFTRDFSRLNVLKLPRLMERTTSFMPKSIRRIIHKGYVKSFGGKLFDQMIHDQIDVLITMDLSKQFLNNYSFFKEFKEKSNIPVLSWIHISLTGNTPKIAQAVYQKMDIFNGHLAISKGLAEELEQDYSARNISMVYNPVDAADLIVRNKTKFIYVGRISKIKRVESLLQQLAKLKGAWSLDIYGSTGNPEEDLRLIHHIKKLGLINNVQFHGWKKDAWRHIQEAGVLLLNSTREGFGLVIVEAMQRGIPVISADCPVGPSELITDGVNGWLYPVPEESKITEFLQEVLDGKRELPAAPVVQNSVKRFETYNYIRQFLFELKKYTGK